MPISSYQTSTVIVSATAPNSPTLGSQWLEVDASNNLVETWFWINNAWRSQVKSWTINANLKDSSVATNFYKPLPSEYDYFLQKCLITANNLNGQLTTSNYFRVAMTCQYNNLTPSSSATTDLNSQGSSEYVVRQLNWNYLFSSSAVNKGLRIIVNKNSSLQGDLNIDYFYQASRK